MSRPPNVVIPYLVITHVADKYAVEKLLCRAPGGEDLNINLPECSSPMMESKLVLTLKILNDPYKHND